MCILCVSASIRIGDRVSVGFVCVRVFVLELEFVFVLVFVFVSVLAIASVL